MPYNALTIGLVAPYGVQPGVEVGAVVAVAEPGPRLRLDVQPRVAVFARPDNHVSARVGAAFGVTVKHATPVAHTFGLGLDYLLQAQVTSWAVDLGTGGRTATRELRHHVLPTGSYTLTHLPSERIGWFFDLDVGHAALPEAVDRLFVSVGLGLTLPLGGR
jgi:hypothetical protein